MPLCSLSFSKLPIQEKFPSVQMSRCRPSVEQRVESTEYGWPVLGHSVPGGAYRRLDHDCGLSWSRNSISTLSGCFSPPTPTPNPGPWHHAAVLTIFPHGCHKVNWIKTNQVPNNYILLKSENNLIVFHWNVNNILRSIFKIYQQEGAIDSLTTLTICQWHDAEVKVIRKSMSENMTVAQSWPNERCILE